MSYSIIPASQFSTINWAGGTSTELYIYPETSDYAQRNFDFRLSTAQVKVNESNFTFLPGVSRKLMILDGQIKISHKNQYEKNLNAFDIDEFEGEWETSSLGICTDFNLMTRGETKAELSSLFLKANESVKLNVKHSSSQIFIYLYSGKLNIKNGESILQHGELLLIEPKSIDEFQFIAHENSRLIIAEINQ